MIRRVTPYIAKDFSLMPRVSDKGQGNRLVIRWVTPYIAKDFSLMPMVSDLRHGLLISTKGFWLVTKVSD